MVDPTVRNNYMPISFVPHQNTSYCALAHNDVEYGQSNPEALNVVPRQQPEESIWKPPAYLAAVKTSRATNRSDDSVVSPSKVTPEKELGERKRPANQGASNHCKAIAPQPKA
jgi:hypothetical protein